MSVEKHLATPTKEDLLRLEEERAEKTGLEKEVSQAKEELKAAKEKLAAAKEKLNVVRVKEACEKYDIKIGCMVKHRGIPYRVVGIEPTHGKPGLNGIRKKKNGGDYAVSQMLFSDWELIDEG